MSEAARRALLAQAQETARRLEHELAETNRGLLALHTELSGAQEELRQIFDAAPAGMVKVDAEGRIVLANTRMERLFGYPGAELLRQSVELLVPELERARLVELCQGLQNQPQSRPMSAGGHLHGRRKDGSTFPVEVDLSRIRTLEGGGVLVSIVDASERKRAEAAIHASLAEKEVLLREIHHRVKNNLQLVVSLLNLQRTQVADPVLREAFSDVEQRIRSMALVHQQLYQEHSLANIELGGYLRMLVGELLQQRPDSVQVRLETDLQPAQTPLDTAIPVGLIATELITNALKYAYRGRAQGLLRVSLQPAGAGRLVLTVSDDGPGLPAGLDPNRTTSLGLRLVSMLARQLRAQVEFAPGPNATCRVSCPREPRSQERAAEGGPT